jgi:hypothetical protein
MRKIIALLMAIIVAAAIFMSVLYIGENLNHHCSGEDCSICMELRTAEAVISNTGMALAAIASIISFLIITVYKPAQKQTKLVGRSLISLKVEILV